jgi:two-component system sensor histidine kinase AlgZ
LIAHVEPGKNGPVSIGDRLSPNAGAAESPLHRLPDFRNLGVLLRILVIVNAGSAAVAVIDAPRLADTGSRLIGISAVLQPILFIDLLLLALAAPWLRRLRYDLGVGIVLGLCLAVTAGMVQLGGELFTRGGADALPRYLFITVIAAGVLLGYFDLRDRSLSPALVEARLQALQARIRPHFLFNSLNAVLSLIRTDPRRAERVLEDLADLFRALMADAGRLSTLAREVELARQYLAIEAVRLGDRLEVEWRTEGMPGEARMPPMILQPLLENAVYHGVEPSSERGRISVRIDRQGERVQIMLRNSVRGGAGAGKPGNRIALDNIRERLALHFDAEASLGIERGAGWFQVTIRFPLTTEQQR